MTQLIYIAFFLCVIYFILSGIKTAIFGKPEEKQFSFTKKQRTPISKLEFQGKPVIGIFLLNVSKEYIHKFYFFATEINENGASGYAHAKHTGHKRGHWTYTFVEFDSNGNIKNKPSINKTNYKPVPYTKIVKEVSFDYYMSNYRNSFF